MKNTPEQIQQLAEEKYPDFTAFPLSHREGFIAGFNFNPNTYTKEEVEILLEQQVTLTASEAQFDKINNYLDYTRIQLP